MEKALYKNACLCRDSTTSQLFTTFQLNSGIQPSTCILHTSPPFSYLLLSQSQTLQNRSQILPGTSTSPPPSPLLPLPDRTIHFHKQQSPSSVASTPPSSSIVHLLMPPPTVLQTGWTPNSPARNSSSIT